MNSGSRPRSALALRPLYLGLGVRPLGEARDSSSGKLAADVTLLGGAAAMRVDCSRRTTKAHPRGENLEVRVFNITILAKVAEA